VKTLRVTFLAPVTVPGPVDLKHNVIGLRNGGNTFVDLFNGSWTLNPGESLMLGSQTDINVVLIDQLLVSFRVNPAETAAPVQSLQLLAINEINQIC